MPGLSVLLRAQVVRVFYLKNLTFLEKLQFGMRYF